jgi:uncharacterized protein with HEPN domain
MPSTPSKSPAGALRDILKNIELARSFVAGLSFTLVWHTIEQSLEPLHAVVMAELERLTKE